MDETLKRGKVASRGLRNSHRYLSKRIMLLNAVENARARKKEQRRKRASERKLRTRRVRDPVKDGPSTDVDKEVALGSAPMDVWEVDSGFCSEVSPPASGRSSPSHSQRAVVALDCEMVGTGPEGRHNEVARCSIVDYHGNVLYDKYIKPCQPVTDFRTRWSGIKRHHLKKATPFSEAREEIIRILEGNFVVGHSIHNDFAALHVLHPFHLIRDTCTTHLLSRLADMQKKHFISLKVLSHRLLHRTIQADHRGHCSVEDARATLDLYKLVEEDWERELSEDGAAETSVGSSSHFMQDEYWPDNISQDATGLG